MNSLLVRNLYEKSFVLRPERMVYKDQPVFDYEKFAKLVVLECCHNVMRCTYRNGDSEHNRALHMAVDQIKKDFGLDG